MLLLDVTQLLKLFLELVNALACAFIVLCDADRLLLLLDLLLFFDPDLAIVFFLTALQLG